MKVKENLKILFFDGRHLQSTPKFEMYCVLNKKYSVYSRKSQVVEGIFTQLSIPRNQVSLDTFHALQKTSY